MKVILLQDVAKIGRRSDVVEVPDGYAMNQLIPKRMAEPATPANIKRIEKMHADKAANMDADTEAFKAAVAAIEATPVSVSVEANEQGHLFKAVNAEDVVIAAKGVGASISEEMVVFANPIKEIGSHKVDLKQGDNTATITISVTAKV